MVTPKQRITRNFNFTNRLLLDGSDFDSMNFIRSGETGRILVKIKPETIDRIGRDLDLIARLEINSGMFLTTDFDLGSITDSEFCHIDEALPQGFTADDNVSVRLRVIDRESGHIVALYEQRFVNSLSSTGEIIQPAKNVKKILSLQCKKTMKGKTYFKG